MTATLRICFAVGSNTGHIFCAAMVDSIDSPRPLRDPCAPRAEGTSIHGHYGNDKGKNYTTLSAQAVQGDEDRTAKSRITSRLVQAGAPTRLVQAARSDIGNPDSDYAPASGDDSWCEIGKPASSPSWIASGSDAAPASGDDSWCEICKPDSCASWTASDSDVAQSHRQDHLQIMSAPSWDWHCTHCKKDYIEKNRRGAPESRTCRHCQNPMLSVNTFLRTMRIHDIVQDNEDP